MDVDAYRALPIPEWLGLNCPKCDYPLRGLPEYRCPECGLQFNIDDLVTPTTPLRLPNITAKTRPVPNLDLECRKCAYPLRGLPDDRCPECGETFDLEDFIPPGQWVEAPGSASLTESILLFSHLRSLGIPCLFEDLKGPLGIRGADVLLGNKQVSLRVRRDYYFDAVDAVINAAEGSDTPWTCPNCSEKVPGNFDVCWKCQSPKS
jgi:hypothetical protein